MAAYTYDVSTGPHEQGAVVLPDHADEKNSECWWNVFEQHWCRRSHGITHCKRETHPWPNKDGTGAYHEPVSDDGAEASW